MKTAAEKPGSGRAVGSGRTVCPHCGLESTFKYAHSLAHAATHHPVASRTAGTHTCSCGHTVMQLATQLVPITVESQVDEPLLAVTPDMLRGPSQVASHSPLRPLSLGWGLGRPWSGGQRFYHRILPDSRYPRQSFRDCHEVYQPVTQSPPPNPNGADLCPGS